MSLSSYIRRALEAILPSKQEQRDRVIDLLPNWSGQQTLTPWAFNRAEFVQHYRGWNYVAIKAIAEQIACMTPLVARVRSGDEIRGQIGKSLREAKSRGQREQIELSYRRYRRKSLALKRKALAHLQDCDELEPVSKDHPLCRLLRNPNGPDVAYSFFFKLSMYMELCGAAYIWCPTNRLGKPAQLWVIPSHWVYEMAGENELVGHYEIRPTAGLMTPDQMSYGMGWFPGAGGRNEKIEADKIIKMAYPNPFSVVDGYAPVGAIGTWIDVSDNMDRSRVQTFYNGIFPGVAVEIDKDFTGPLDDAKIERLRSGLASNYGSVRNTGKPVVLGPGMKLVPWSRTNVEMDYVNSADQNKSWLLAGHKVPQSIAGLTEQSTYANAAAAQWNFFGSTIRPKVMYLGQVMTEKLAKRFGDDLITYWDEPTPHDPEMDLRRRESMYTHQIITPNEWREMESLEPWEHGGDDPVGTPGMTPLPWATGEDPMQGMGGMPGMPGMPGIPGQEQPEPTMGDALGDLGGGEQSGDAAEPTLEDALGDLSSIGADGASESAGLPSPLGKSFCNRINGKVNGHAHT